MDFPSKERGLARGQMQQKWVTDPSHNDLRISGEKSSCVSEYLPCACMHSLLIFNVASIEESIVKSSINGLRAIPHRNLYICLFIPLRRVDVDQRGQTM